MLFSKDIILYDKHRQTVPVANHPMNQKKYWFVDVGVIWKYIPFKTTDKRKHQVMYVILSLLKPKYIVSMNWISKRESLYKLWTTKNPSSKFIVVQHGSYVGGIVTDIPHRYTKCDVFLTWSTYFVDQFNQYNSQKKVQLISFGNTIYNDLNRAVYTYKNNKNSKILLLPTALDHDNIEHFYNLLEKLKNLGFDVFVKQHGKQGTELNPDQTLKFPVIEGVTILRDNLYMLLESNLYDLIISDHSSSLLDAIFYKNKVLYFDPNNNTKGYKTNYSNYLTNIFNLYNQIETKDKMYEVISIANQEVLFNNMIHPGNNVLEDSLFS